MRRKTKERVMKEIMDDKRIKEDDEKWWKIEEKIKIINGKKINNTFKEI